MENLALLGSENLSPAEVKNPAGSLKQFRMKCTLRPR